MDKEPKFFHHEGILGMFSMRKVRANFLKWRFENFSSRHMTLKFCKESQCFEIFKDLRFEEKTMLEKFQREHSQGKYYRKKKLHTNFSKKSKVLENLLKISWNDLSLFLEKKRSHVKSFSIHFFGKEFIQWWILTNFWIQKFHWERGFFSLREKPSRETPWCARIKRDWFASKNL